MRSFSQNTNYHVVFGTPNLRDIKYYLQKCNIPSVELSPEFINNDKLKLIASGTDIQFGEFTFSIIVDEFFESYTTLLDELYSYKDIQSGSFNQNSFETALMITSNKGNPFMKFVFQDCYITSLAGLEFDDRSKSDTFSVDVTISFNYMYYERL